jgi:hypothetical protein
MSENTPTYGAPERVPKAIAAFKNLPCAKPFSEWTPPEPEQVKALIELSGMNRRHWADLLGISYSDKHGSTTIRKWCMNKDAKDYREIPFSTWRLMLIYAGVIDPKHDVLGRVLSSSGDDIED